MSRPKVLSTGPALHPDAIALLQRDCELVMPANDDPDLLRRNIADAEGLIVRTKLPDDVFDHATRLRACVRHGVGLDFIPVEAASARGIPVANLPFANSQAVIEHTIGVALALARDLCGVESRFRSGGWGTRGFAGVELAGKTLGVVGCGHIGRGVARAMRSAFGMRVLGYNRSPITEPDIEQVALDRLFREADIISLHIASTPETRGLVDAAVLSAVKPGAILVNTARGDLIDTQALIAALQDGRLRAAGLDVFEPEPLPADDPLLGAPNLLLTPHIAGLTGESARRMSVESAEEMLRLLRGEAPLNLVNGDALGRR
ncbi:hydroxyacid dehydrogenase [Terrihabitans sp. B22-R8]|uniref:hydroxyacid dehydrogenase n=1 Tax=Terrihabitans sp. B22-R8 TaxID=3425128 RepID=UPI00403CE2DE